MSLFSKKKNRKKIGLALGSGGFRGAAHVSIIKALVDNNIPIDFIAGSSIGALIGAHYAIFKDVDRIVDDIFKEQDKKYRYLKDLSLKNGILSGKAFERAFLKMFKGAEFKNTQIPLRVTATDLISGQAYIFKKGDIAQAVRASISVPLAFKPLKYEDMLLIDGGVSKPVPDDIVKEMGADIVISVNLYDNSTMITKNPSTSRILNRVIEIVLQDSFKANTKNSDIIISPDVSKYAETSILKAYSNQKVFLEMMKEGEKEVKKVLPKIKKLIA